MYNNPYFNQQQRFQGMNMMQQPMPTQQYIPPMPTIQQNNLQGKIVDSVEVVKAMDIPLDGSVSYLREIFGYSYVIMWISVILMLLSLCVVVY